MNKRSWIQSPLGQFLAEYVCFSPCKPLLGALPTLYNIRKTWLASKALIRKNKKIQQQNVTPVSIEPGTSVIWIWCSPLWTIKACTTREIQDLCTYGHALLVLTKRYQSKTEALDLNGWGPMFNTHWGNILLLDFLFWCSKVSVCNIAIIANSLCLWKTRLCCHWLYRNHIGLKKILKLLETILKYPNTWVSLEVAGATHKVKFRKMLDIVWNFPKNV